MAKPNPSETVADNARPTILTVVGSDTITIPRHMKVRCSKGTVADIDLGKIKTPQERGELVARAFRTLANDGLGEKGLENPQDHLTKMVARWIESPTGVIRGERDEFLAEARRVIARAGIMKASDAKSATLAAIESAAGKKWSAVKAMVERNLADARALAEEV